MGRTFHRHQLIPFLVIIQQVNIECVPGFKAEHDAPLAACHDAPLTLSLTLQVMQSIVARKVNISRMRGGIYVAQNVLNPFRLIRSHFSCSATPK